MDAEEIQELAEKKIDAGSISSGCESGSGMTLKERWRRTMFYQSVDKRPNMEFGYWAETLTEWHKQGLPETIVDEKSAYEFFGIENWEMVWANVGLIPAFPHEIIEEDENYQIYRDSSRVTCKINTTGHKSIPHYIDFGLKDRKDWELFKEKLDPDDPKRFPENWDELVSAYNNTDKPLGINFGSMIGVPRNWIGFENIALMTYDDPELLEEIVETLCQVSCTVLEKVLKDVSVDFGAGWEDICFNSGPIVSPAFMREVVLPRYKRITDLLKKHGVYISWTDCDGNLNPIADIFMEGGINCMFPVEVNGGTDPVALRERFGTEMHFQGGFCKMKFCESPEAIEKELLRLLPVVEEGGFVPGVDHRVQADAPLSNYIYYMKRKRELYNLGGTPQYDESKVGLVNGTVELPKF
ncbi:MAG: uroporphyrinogen decarboxylase family protein [Planctomycetota bacterium]|jgi:uroporphyrinogen decarboxylase